MYLWQKGDLGEYLTETEKELLKHSQQSFDDYCDEKQLNKNSPKNFVAYLNHNADIHEPARFSGKLSERMGLEYNDKTFVKMISRQSPLTAKQWQAKFPNIRYPKNGRMARNRDNPGTGQHLILAAPKSLSMAYSIADREQQQKIRNAIKTADAQMENEMARYIKPSSPNYIFDWQAKDHPDHNPRFIIDSSKTELFWANYTHYESRGVEAHLHTHKQLGPVGVFHTMDGKEHLLVLDPEECYKRQKELTSNYNTLLANELDEIGIRIQDDREYGNQHAFRVSGIDRDDEILLSSRGAQIESEIRKRYKLDQNAVITEPMRVEYQAKKEEIWKQTRAEKMDLSAGEIHATIKENTQNILGVAGLERLQDVQNGKIAIEKPKAFDITRLKEFQLNGVASESVIRAEIGNQMRWKKPRPKSLEEIKRAVDQEFQSLTTSLKIVPMEDGRITTIEFIRLERENADHIARLIKKPNTTINPRFEEQLKTFQSKQGLTLNAGQEATLKAGYLDNDLFTVNAAAGSGKTSTTIRGLNDLWTSQPYEYQYGKVQVIGLATQDITSNALKDADIQNCQNTMAFCSRYYDFEKNTFKEAEIKALGRANLRAVIDEASMLSSSHFNVLLGLQERLQKQGGSMKMAWIGDTKQLASVGAGSTFSYAVKECLKVRDDQGHCVNYATMDETVRHKLEETKTIAEAFQQREPAKALEALKKQGWWSEIGNTDLDRDQRMTILSQKLAEDFVSSQREEKVAIAFTNKDVDRINDAIREELLKQPYSPIRPETQRLISVYEKGASKESQNQRELNFGVGDEIIMTAKCPVVAYNPKKKAYEAQRGTDGKKVFIDNGSTGKIVNIEEAEVIRGQTQFKITVDFDGKQQTLFTGYKDNRVFNHAYCRTSYSSQGATVDETFVYCSSATNANSSYVNFSRSRYEVKGYILEGDEEKWLKNAANDMTKDTTMDSELCREAYKRHIAKGGIGGSGTGGAANTKPVEVKIAARPEVQQPINNNDELLEEAAEVEARVKDKLAERERKKQEGIKAMEEKHGIKINQGRDGIDRGGFGW